MSDGRRERYINPYTDFGFTKLFEQAEIARKGREEGEHAKAVSYVMASRGVCLAVSV